MELCKNPFPSAPPVEDEYYSPEHFVYVNNIMPHYPPRKRLPPSPKNFSPQPSAPPPDNVDYTIYNATHYKPDYRYGNQISIPGYIRQKKVEKKCCIIC